MGNKKVFKFDKVVDENWTQQQVFNELKIKSLISKVMNGYHATIFAFGQTGSGKTYSMEGYEYINSKNKSSSSPNRNVKPIIKDGDNVGISIRAIKEVFDQAKTLNFNKSKRIRISCSFLQIYNEKIYDLLNLSNIQSKLTLEGSTKIKIYSL